MTVTANSYNWFNSVNSVSNFTIGVDHRASNFWFNGTMDNFMIYDRPLSADEISLIYNNTVAGIKNNYTEFNRKYIRC